MKKMLSIYPIWSCYVYKKEYSLFGLSPQSHLSCIYVEKITMCIYACPQCIDQKCNVHKQSHQCYVYKKEYFLLITILN